MQAQLASKYPAAEGELPEVTRASPIDHLMGLRDSLLTLDKAISPGTGGLRPEYLVTIAEIMDGQQMSMLEDFGLRYLRGELPHWFTAVWLTVNTVPIHKTAQQDTIRPLGIRNPLIKAMHKEVMKENRQEFTRFLEPQQLVLSRAGGSKLVFSVRMLLEARPDFINVKNDIRNAYNEIERGCILSALNEEPTLQHLAWHAAVILAPHHGLESGGKRWGKSSRGNTQGSNEASALFCTGWHKHLRQLDAKLQRVGGMAKAGADDLNAVGPEEVVFPALEVFWAQVYADCGLTVQRSKTEVFAWPGTVIHNLPEGLTRSGVEVDGHHEDGFILYGVPLGTDTYVKHQLDKKVNEILEGATKASITLMGEKQCLWTVLRSSLKAQFEYWLALVHPSQVEAAARRVDTVLWGVLENVIGFDLPREAEGLGWEHCLDIPVQGLGGRSFQAWVAGLPIRLGGLGIPGQEELAPLAYIGALEQTLPYYGGEDGICPQLAHLVGEPGATRWTPLIQSGCRTGRELARVWQRQQELVRGCHNYLGEQFEGPFSVPVEEVGEGSEDGSTRRRLGEAREQLMGRVLQRALLLHPDQSSGPVSSWKERDKLSTAWLLSLPGPHYGISSAVFTEALATLLCSPSPACSARLGQKIGQARVDLFGAKVVNERLEGNHWTRRHDMVKAEINSLCAFAGLPAQCEAYNVFGHLVPQQPLNRLEGHRARQILRPDFLLQVPDPITGIVRFQVADVKTIGLGAVTYYKPGAEGTRAVERRSRRIQGEYEAGARRGDVLAGAQPGQGPVSQKLAEVGPVWDLTTGGFFEGSAGVHRLVGQLTDSWATKQLLATGRPPGEGQKSTTVGLMRRRLSTAIVKANTSVLLGRLGMVGEGAAMARGRRQWGRMEEERMRREREAAWRADTTGREVVRRGRFWLQ